MAWKAGMAGKQMAQAAGAAKDLGISLNQQQGEQ